MEKYTEMVYEWMTDDVSKKIYRNRMMYRDTLDYKYIQDTVDEFRPEIARDKWFEISDRFINDITKYDNTIIYGAGERGKLLTRELSKRKYKIPCIIDNFVSGFFDGIAIIKQNDFSTDRFANYCVVISLSDKNESLKIKEYLLESGFSDNDILLFSDYVAEANSLHEIQYFDDESIISYGDKEVFVDCGVLDFETSSVFISQCKKHDVSEISVIAFEPDNHSYDVCLNEIQKDVYKNIDIRLFNKGVWSETRNIGFCSSKIDKTAKQYIEVVALDDVIKEAVTFIKMDIEGAELEALKGAKELISKYRPKLAISIYHKPEDYYEIPMFIKSIVPEYNLYVRHYSNNSGELVLYAVL